MELGSFCVYPFTGPLKWPKFTSSPHADWGNAIDDVANEECSGRDADLDAIATKWKLDAAQQARFVIAARYLIDFIRGESHAWDKPQYEVLIDIDTMHAREAHGATRRFDEHLCKIDLLYQEDDGGLIVIRDVKTGQSNMGRAAIDSLQLGVYALAIASMYGVRRVGVEFVHVSEMGIRPNRAILGEFDLQQLESRIAGIVQRCKDRTAPPTPGPWCEGHFCPVIEQCPVTVQAARAAMEVATANGAVVADALRRVLSGGSVQSHEEASALYIGSAMLAKALSAVDKTVEAYVRAHGAVPLPNGKVLAEVTKDANERVACSDETTAILYRHLGDYASRAIERSTSKAAIERALRESGNGGRGMKRVLLPIFNELREAGCITRGAPHRRVEEVDPAKLEEKEEDNGG